MPGADQATGLHDELVARWRALAPTLGPRVHFASVEDIEDEMTVTYLRDTAQILILALTFLFWTTPIFIAEAQYPKWSRFAIRLNPLAYVVRAYRDRLLSARPPAWEDVVIITL